MQTTLDKKRLAALAKQIRRDSIRMVRAAGSGHPGGAMGAAEILALLYGGLLEQRSKEQPTAGPDRFVLSNGHICAGWYSALSLAGQMPREELRTHRRLGSRLQGHPSRHMFPQAVETSSGPLGQGFSVASGIALGKKLRKENGRVYCLAGDGEMQEGLIWETALTAAHYRLDNLVLIVNDNDVQIDGHTSTIKNVRPIGEKFRSFGWEAMEVDGHDIEELLEALAPETGKPGRPRCVVARTVMAKGVSFMEHDPKWHGACPSEEEAERALGELGHADQLEDF